MRKYWILFLLVTPWFYNVSAQTNTDSLEQAVQVMPADTARVMAFFNLSRKLASSNFVKAYSYAQQAHQLSVKLSYPAGEVLGLIGMGNAHRLQANYDSSLFYFQKSLTLSRKADHTQGIGLALNGIGVVHFRRGDYRKALQHFIPALKAAEKINDRLMITNLLNNIALIYDEQGNFSQAIPYFEQSLKIKKELGDRKAIASTLNNLALSYYHNKDTVRALQIHQESLQIKQQLDDQTGIALSLYNIGEIYIYQGKYREAEEMLTRSLQIWQKVNERLMIGETLSHLGLLYRQQEMYAKAITHFEQSLKIVTEIGSQDITCQLYKHLAETHARQGNYQTSADYYEQYVWLSEKITRETNSRQMAEMQAKYETEAKQKEIAALNHDRQLTEQNNRLVRNSLMGGITLLIGMLLVAFVAYRQKRKAHHEISQKNYLLEQQKEELEIQKHEIQRKNINITDSIRYAQTIQSAILPAPQAMKDAFADFFVIYEPRDMVSGDFYWFNQVEQKIFIAVIDCTGHGVPGAFMSLIGNTILNKIISEVPDASPAHILEKLNIEVRAALRQDHSSNDDGMDVGLVALEPATGAQDSLRVTFAGAKRPLYKADLNGNISEIKGSPRSIGGRQKDQRGFSDCEFTLLKNECLYLTTDGFVDQNNSHKEKLGSQRFKTLLHKVASFDMRTQQQLLISELRQFKDTAEQRDDITIVGIRA